MKKIYITDNATDNRPERIDFDQSATQNQKYIYAYGPNAVRPQRKTILDATIEGENVYTFDDSSGLIAVESVEGFVNTPISNLWSINVGLSQGLNPFFNNCYTGEQASVPVVIALDYTGDPLPAYGITIDLTYTGSQPSVTVNVALTSDAGSQTTDVIVNNGQTVKFAIGPNVLDGSNFTNASLLITPSTVEYDILTACNITLQTS